jgi:hypothetical protein
MTDPYYLRRRDPAPVGHGGEVALCVFAGVLLVLSITALAGLGVASALFGDGWVWPHGTAQIRHAFGGLFGGRPGRGLPARLAARVPGAAAVYASVATCELIAAALIVVTITWAVRWRRPGDLRRGMATRGEVREVLGSRRLHRARRLIRPDLSRTPERTR